MTQPPDLASLRLLVLVGELGSLGRAAQELGVAQPSASKRLSTLERRLGLVLVDRGKRGSALTPAGVVVSERARRVLDEVSGLLAGAEALRREHAAQLRVAASMTVAEHLAPTWIGELRRDRPDLHVGLRVTNSETVLVLLREGAVDLGFVEAPGPLRGLSSRVVATDRLAVVVPPGHRWARRPVTAAELAATPLVVRERGSGTRDTLDRALPGACPPALELGSTTAVRGAVVAGVAPAVLSVLAAAADLADGRLVEVPVAGLDLRRVLRAVWPGGRRLVGPAAELLAVAVRRSSMGP
ncbi:LysR substrate-binding domain-containing protein [Saccharothrix obliqua]|uniref:LysR substrate-binding domain-containing protein n=1 Tax=Saccharothrix obliqua TaxID=2861747 RepID=UPI001C5D8B7E|nr:LysR substrate-binding domain-containing protein [Saccharothrix obliqua]MBW4716574.1 LysR family transcriptional regulator [Saccharothrix obliqua]